MINKQEMLGFVIIPTFILQRFKYNYSISIFWLRYYIELKLWKVSE
jgi:hypothetical protein